MPDRIDPTAIFEHLDGLRIDRDAADFLDIARVTG